MSALCISLLHATKGRPKKAVETMRLWHRMAKWPDAIEHIFACESDDTTVTELMDELERGVGFSSKVVSGKFGGSAPAWDAAWKASMGMLLVQVSDDFECPHLFDDLLLRRLPEDWQEGRYVIAVNDGYRKDRLLTMFICTRAYVEMQGEFIHPGYQSVWSDCEATYCGYANQRGGKCQVIEARDLTFAHHHHAADPRVPKDATYEWQNRPQAYALGEELFKARNPDAMRDQQLWR